IRKRNIPVGRHHLRRTAHRRCLSFEPGRLRRNVAALARAQCQRCARRAFSKLRAYEVWADHRGISEKPPESRLPSWFLKKTPAEFSSEGNAANLTYRGLPFLKSPANRSESRPPRTRGER